MPAGEDDVIRVRGPRRWRTPLPLALAIAVLSAWAGPAGAQQNGDDAAPGVFRIGPEDLLEISVWRDEALSRVVPVRPDGKISLPLIHDVQAAGLTPMQLQDALAERLRKYVATPQVSVIVREVHSFKVSVIGEVRTPGRYELKSQATVIDVLAQAGGFSEYASRSRIVVLRMDGETLRTFPFNYEKFVSADGDQQVFHLKAGDIVVVR
jgi:polysaccharide export outer membrane protein